MKSIPFEKLRQKTLMKRYSEEVMMFHKAWAKVFGVVEFEFMNALSKFWKHFLVQKTLRKSFLRK